MKQVLIGLFSLISFIATAQQYTPSTSWGNSFKRLAILEADTVGTKVAGSLTVINGVLYVANGTKWAQVQGGSSTVDSLIYATWKRVYKVNDSMKVVYNSLYNFTNGYGLNKSGLTFLIDTSNIQKKLSAGTGIAIIGNTIYNTGSTASGKVFAGNGLTNVNDSTLRTDTSTAVTGTATVGYALNLYNILDAAKISSGSSASLQNLSISGTGGNGYIHLKHQSSDATTPASSSVLFANSSGYMKWKNDGGYYSTFAMPQTADRVYTFLDKNYTLGDVQYSDTTNRTTGIRGNARAIGDSTLLRGLISTNTDSIGVHNNRIIQNYSIANNPAASFLPNNQSSDYGGYESDFYVSNDTTYQWIALTHDSTQPIKLRYSVDYGKTWSSYSNTNLYKLFPQIEYYNGAWYAVATSFDVKRIYLFKSTDKLNFTVQNSGNPIITANATTTDWRYAVFNSGFTIVNDTLHILTEGSAIQNGTGGYYASKPFLGYAKAPLATPTITLPTKPSIIGGNPKLYYIQEKNAMFACYGDYSGIFPDYTKNWQIKFAAANYENNLTDSANWQIYSSKYLNDTLGNAADPTFAFYGSKKDTSLFYWNKNQVAESYIRYFSGINSPLSLYNSVLLDQSRFVQENKVYNTLTIKIPNTKNGVGIKLQAATSSGVGSQPSLNYADSTGAEKFKNLYDVNSNTLYTTNSSSTVITSLDQSGNFTANSIIKSGGTGSQLLAANGSTITAGTNITISGSTISASGGTSLSLSAIGSSPNANGATLSGSTLNLEPASASFGGVVTTGTQTFSGQKTFANPPILQSYTSGNIPFFGTSGVIVESVNFKWDSTNKRLAIGNITPAYSIDIANTGASNGVRVTNSTNTGLATYAARNNSNQTASYGISGSSYSTYGVISPSNAFLYSDQSFAFACDNASGEIKFGVGSSVPQSMKITSSAVTINSLGTGIVYSNSGVLTNINPSDSRLKNNIKSLNYGLDAVLKLKPKSFYYNSDTAKKNLTYGLIAQDVQQVIPELVRKVDNKYLGIKSEDLVPILINAIQELNKKIEALEKKIK